MAINVLILARTSARFYLKLSFLSLWNCSCFICKQSKSRSVLETPSTLIVFDFKATIANICTLYISVRILDMYHRLALCLDIAPLQTDGKFLANFQLSLFFFFLEAFKLLSIWKFWMRAILWRQENKSLIVWSNWIIPGLTTYFL